MIEFKKMKMPENWDWEKMYTEEDRDNLEDFYKKKPIFVRGRMYKSINHAMIAIVQLRHAKKALLEEIKELNIVNKTINEQLATYDDSVAKLEKRADALESENLKLKATINSALAVLDEIVP